MNAEQLHTVCKELESEMSSNEIVGLLEELEVAVSKVATAPGVPEYEKDVGLIRAKLEKSMSLITKADRPVAKRQIIEEIGGASLINGSLLKELQDSFTQKEVTMSLVQKDISKLKVTLTRFYNGLVSLKEGFENFNIEFEELEPYTAELGIIIPRANNDSLAFIAEELKRLERDFQAFSELVTGQTDPFRVKTISSSNYAIFIEMLPDTAEGIAMVIAFLVFAYERLLNIRVLRKQLKDEDVPDSKLEPLDEHAAEYMETEIEKITQKLLDQNKNIERADGRINELERHVKHSVRRLAKRIDNGYNFSARIGPIPDPDDEEIDKEFERKQEIVQSIVESSRKIEHRQLSGEPILPLEWLAGNNNNDSGENNPDE